MSKKNMSICGLNCAKCGAYLAMLNDDNILRAKTANEWNKQFSANFKPEDINCVGCSIVDGVHSGYCGLCSVRKCALAKNIANCALCAEYKTCQICRDFETTSGLNIESNIKQGGSDPIVNE